MMLLVLDDDERLLAESARAFLGAESPTSRFRALRDAGATHDAPLWAQLVELGWPAIPFETSQGGLGLGLAGLGVVLEELGRVLAPTPLVSTAAAATLPVPLGAEEGDVVALAWREHARDGDLRRCETRVQEGRISGRKVAVNDALAADCLVVSAVSEGRLGLWRVDAAATRRVALSRVDHRDAADVLLDEVPGEALDLGLDHLVAAVDAMRVARAAEALGTAHGAFELTLAHMHARHQFGRPIGAFQALQHRLVDAFVQLELARSAVMQALRQPTPRWAALAEAKTAHALWQVCTEAVQLHGGIGMTEEHDVGLYLKRAMVVAREADGAVSRFGQSNRPMGSLR